MQYWQIALIATQFSDISAYQINEILNLICISLFIHQHNLLNVIRLFLPGSILGGQLNVMTGVNGYNRIGHVY